MKLMLQLFWFYDAAQYCRNDTTFWDINSTQSRNVVTFLQYEDGVEKISRNIVLLLLYEDGIGKISRKSHNSYNTTVRHNPKSYNIRKHTIINLVKERMDWRETDIFLSARRDGYLTCSMMTNLSYADKSRSSLVLKQKGARQRELRYPLTESLQIILQFLVFEYFYVQKRFYSCILNNAA